MFDGFYKGKRVLVTGVAGVKGTWLALMLLKAGAEVIGVDVSSPDEKPGFRAAGLSRAIRYVQGDVCDLRLMEALADQVDGVFHLAAVALVGEARQRPLDTYRINTFGTAVVLEAVRLSASVKYAVLVTTDKVYKPKGEAWNESDPLVASGPYAVSKACAEYVLADYYANYLKPLGKRMGVARAGNIIVGGDFYSSRNTGGAGRIVVDCCEALSEGRPPEIFNPKFTRPYMYGLDVLAGYMTLMSQLDADGVDGNAFNFGPHESHGVENALVATKACDLWDTGIVWKGGTPREEPFEKQSLSWDQARQKLAWQPAYTIFETLRDTIYWYKNWNEVEDKCAYSCMAEVNDALFHKHRESARVLGLAWAQPVAQLRTDAYNLEAV